MTSAAAPKFPKEKELKIAVTTLPVSGHLNPMTSLARKLKANGHDVVMVSVPDVEKRAQASGLNFLSVGAEAFPLGGTRRAGRLFSTHEGDAALQFTFDLMSKITGTLLRPLAEALRFARPDGVVFDTYQPYLELAAVSSGLPYVHVANAAHFDVSGETPLCFFDWPNDHSPEARRRNQRGVERFRKLLEPSLAVAKTYADEIGLSVDWSDLAATRSKRAWITQMPEAFDFESPLVPREFHHTGPFIDGVGRPRIDFPWEKLTGDSLVYASMGTLQNGSQAVFRTISEVANERKQLQFVVAAGKNVDLTPLLPGPPNVIFVEHAPQLELLKKAALCITHGGLNTVLESLSEGVPLLALPVTNDQPGVAARIEEHKVGEFLPLPRLSTERLGELVDCVLTNPEYQQNASRMKNAIIRTDGLSLAATTIANALQSPSYKG